MEDYLDALTRDGPQAVRKQGGKYAWFPLHDESGFDDFILADHAGKTYILLCNESDKTMLQKAGRTPWRLRRASLSFRHHIVQPICQPWRWCGYRRQGRGRPFP